MVEGSPGTVICKWFYVPALSGRDTALVLCDDMVHFTKDKNQYGRLGAPPPGLPPCQHAGPLWLPDS